jgi:hypothetical protein
MRAVLGWLRGEAKHCSMAAIPSIAEEDARRPTRERETRDAVQVPNPMPRGLSVVNTKTDLLCRTSRHQPGSWSKIVKLPLIASWRVTEDSP